MYSAFQPFLVPKKALRERGEGVLCRELMAHKQSAKVDDARSSLGQFAGEGEDTGNSQILVYAFY